MPKKIAIVRPTFPITWQASLCLILSNTNLTALPKNWTTKKVIRLLVVLSEDLNHLSSIRAKNINNKTSIKSQIWKGVLQAIKPVKEEKAKI